LLVSAVDLSRATELGTGRSDEFEK